MLFLSTHSVFNISLFSVISIFSVNSIAFYNFQSSTQTLSTDSFVAMDMQAGFAPYTKCFMSLCRESLAVLFTRTLSPAVKVTGSEVSPSGHAGPLQGQPIGY